MGCFQGGLLASRSEDATDLVSACIALPNWQAYQVRSMRINFPRR